MKNKFKRGEMVYTVLRHVSRSGMYRVIDMFVVRKGEIVRVAMLLDEKTLKGLCWNGKKDGFVRTGCGMDMGFDLVYSLSRRLFKEHSEAPIYTKDRKGRGGYALEYRWL